MHRTTVSVFFCSVQKYDSSPQGKSLLIIPPLTDVTCDKIGREGISLQVKYLTAKAVVKNQPSPSWLSNATTGQKKGWGGLSLLAQAPQCRKVQVIKSHRSGMDSADTTRVTTTPLGSAQPERRPPCKSALVPSGSCTREGGPARGPELSWIAGNKTPSSQALLELGSAVSFPALAL